MSIKVTGLDSFTTQLGRLTADIQHINNEALFDAAGFVADEIGKALQAMPTYDKWYGTDGHPIYGVTPSEKAQIIENFGIARFQFDGDGSQTSIGFTGYVNTPSTKYNNKVPTGMLMQCVEYGTKFRKGTHTIAHAEKAAKDQAVQIIQNKLTEKIQKAMEE